MKYEMFDSKRHSLEDFAFDMPAGTVVPVTMSADGDEDDKKMAKKRTCMACYLRKDTPSMADVRRFRMTPDDAALTCGNAKKRMMSSFIPALFEHGWSMSRGGIAGGKALDVFEQDGDIWIKWELDEQTWQEAVEPGLNWLGRSAGFRGWKDQDGFIRPADLLEGSFTNFPAMNGLGNVIPMSEAQQRYATAQFSARPYVFLNGVYSPDQTIVTTSETGTTTGASLTTSPATASHRKEKEQMKNLTTLLGLAENASEEEVLAAMQALKEKAEKPAPAQAATETPDIKAMVQTLFTEEIKRHGDAIKAEYAAQERERTVKAKIESGRLAGKITKDNEAAWTKLAQGDLETFDQLLAAAPVLRPVGRVVERGAVHTFGDDESVFAGLGNPADYCQAIADATVAFGCSVSQAIQIVNAGGMAKEN